MIPLDDARREVLAACPPLRVVPVRLRDALGHVTAEDVLAAEDVPPFDNSAVDGFAVRAADVTSSPVVLRVDGTIAAGAAPTGPVGPGGAIRIMTGAPLPPGADAVVMVEDTEVGDGGRSVRINRPAVLGDAVRRAGDDVHKGDLLFPAGTELRPAVVGVLASVGLASVRVVSRPRVGVLSTGDELVEDGAPLGPGQIRESNRTMLLGAVGQAGCTAVDLGLVRDDEAALEAVLADAAARCDAVVTSGGVSMGDYDIVKAVLGRLATMRWMQIAIRPAKPFAFGLLSGVERPVPVFGLPGNPVSSLVSFELLARPALRQMMGHSLLDRPRVRAVADEGFRRRPDGKTHWNRVVGRFEDDGRLHVRSTGGQGSHQLASTAAANGLAAVRDGDGIAPGGDVDVLLLT
ncbi:MAG TPA: gephyrin-like molybdotransferase Glp [Acidimicrobiales bacterium]